MIQAFLTFSFNCRRAQTASKSTLSDHKLVGAAQIAWSFGPHSTVVVLIFANLFFLLDRFFLNRRLFLLNRTLVTRFDTLLLDVLLGVTNLITLSLDPLRTPLI